MHKNFWIFFLFLFTYNFVYSQSYQVVFGGEKYSNNYYQTITKVEIQKPFYGDYLENTFYIKTKNNFDNKFLKQYLLNKIKSYGYLDIKINNISQPFTKYFSNHLLSKSKYNLENIFKIDIENDFDIFDICSLLTNENEIIYSVPVFNYKISDFKPNDEFIENQYYLDSLNIFKAWDIVKADKSIIIGIVDSGTDINHSDLKSQAWVNTGEIPNDGIDNDGNGFIDDINGWDFVGNIGVVDALKGDFKEDNNVVPSFQSNDHGTHVAGISSASTNNQIGIASTGFNVTFLPVKIAIDDLSNSRMVYRPYEGMLYAAKNGANIINCSWSSAYHDPLAWDVVNEILDMGIVVVAATGNESFRNDLFPYYPAMIPGVIAVGSISKKGGLSGFSNYGINTCCYTYGENIYSTLNNDRYGIKSGTSMSSPIVAGFIANLMKVFPNYSNKQIYHQLRSTSSQFKILSEYTNGILNPYDALKYNNPSYPEFKLPGLEIESVLIKNSNQIVDYGTTNIRLILKNHLSTAQNVKINLQTQNDYLSLISKSYNINEIKNGDTISLDLEINFYDFCPWYEGTANILVKFEADNYENTQLINIPFKFETNNKYRLVETFPGNYNFDWYAACSNDLYNFWALAYDKSSRKGLLYNFGGTNGLTALSNDKLIDLSVINNTIYIAANANTDKASLLKSTNGGLTFKTINLDEYLTYINSIYFSSESVGIITGVNLNNEASIIYTDNGGITFSTINNFPPIDFDEFFSTKIIKRYDKFYFATTKGKIFYSEKINHNYISIVDNSKINILKIAPISKDTIYYFGYNSNKEFELKFTTNSGKSFKTVKPQNIDLSRVLDIFSPDSSNSIYLVLNNAEIYSSDDLAETWTAELNSQYKYDFLTSNAIYSKKGKGRLWFAGIDISYLDFDIKPANISHNLNIAGKYEIDFDTLKINTQKEEIIFIENQGNIKEEINLQYLENGAEFSLTDKFKKLISPSELISATIAYNPHSVGEHFDTLTIISNSANKKFEFLLKGFAFDPSSVSDDQYYEISYNLSSDNQNLYLYLFSKISQDYNFGLYDNNGKLIKDFGKYSLNSGDNTLIFNKIDLVSGLYLLRINNNHISKTIKYIVIK